MMPLLAQVEAAYVLAGIDSLAAITSLLRRLLQCHASDTSSLPAGLVTALNQAVSTLQSAMDCLLSGERVPLPRLLPCWTALAAWDPTGSAHPSAMLSLQVDRSTLPAIAAPHDAMLPADPRSEFERALLVYLRADSAAERLQAVNSIALVITALTSRQPQHADTTGWQVVQAAVSLMAEDSTTDAVLAKKILAATGRLIRQIASAVLPAVPAPLIREALFLIVTATRQTTISAPIVRAFDLMTQWPAEANAATDTGLNDFRVVNAVRQAIQVLSERMEGPTPDGLPGAAELTPLIQAVTQWPALEPLAAALSGLQMKLSASTVHAAQALPLAVSLLGLESLAGLMAQCAPCESDQAIVSHVAETIDLIGESPNPHIAHRWQRIGPALQMPAVLAALTSAMLNNLTVMERQIEQVIEEDPTCAERDAAQVLANHRIAEIHAALFLLDRPTTATQLESLVQPMHRLLRESFAGQPVQPLDAFAQQFAGLCASIAAMPRHHPIPWADAISDSSSSASTNAVSPALRAIFLAEATERLCQLQSYLAPPDPDAALSIDAATHAAHALAGCSATVGLSAMHELALAMEAWLTAIPAGGQPAVAARLLLREVLALMEQMLADWSSGVITPMPPDQFETLRTLLLSAPATVTASQRNDGTAPVVHELPPALADHLDDIDHADHDRNIVSDPVPDMADLTPIVSVPSSASTSLPATIPTDSVSAPVIDAATDELRKIFIEEAADLMPQLDQQLRQWIAAPADDAAPAQMLRLLHTLKGSARMAGEITLGDAFHRMEQTVAELARRLPPETGAIRSLESTLDQLLQPFVTSVMSSPWPPSAIDPVRQRLSHTGDDVEPTPMAVVPPAGNQGHRALAVPAHNAQAGGEKSPLSLQLRVRADFLDRITDAGAELLVGSARMSNELQQQRQSVSDLADNLSRLRSQLRELEIHAESRIASGAMPSATAQFDPLEFDRYTRLHELTRMMSESIADIVSLHRTLSRQLERSSQVITAQSQHARLLQSDLRRVRTLPFASLNGRLQHLLRQAARDTGVDVALEINGSDVDVDRGVLDRLIGPLEHLLRNAVAHGIETAAERLALGKPATGQIRIVLSQEGNTLLLHMSDDGRGLDLQRIRERAIALGLLDADARADQAALSNLIFEAGFSTANEITALSGRGIGMDAVRATVNALGGQLKVSSQSGSGTCFTLILPLTLATLQVVLVTAGSRDVALPATLVQQMVQLSSAALADARKAGTIEWQGRHLPLHPLAVLLGEPAGQDLAHRTSVAILKQLDQYLAIELDAVAGHREVVVKNLGPQLARVPGLAGATVLGDGRITLIINPLPLPEFVATRRAGHCPGVVPASTLQHVPAVLVVDDSLTVRRASQRLLERHGYRVVLARDGIDALEQLRLISPVAVLLDIEMPRMDGFELLAVLRDDARWHDLPVAMITSRTAERHREHAMKLGATAYLGKPFVEEELLALLTQWLAPSGAEDTLNAA